MPKVYLREQDRLNNRMAKWVYGELSTRGMTQKEIADARNISPQAVSKKLKTESFDFEDLCVFYKLFKPDLETLAWLIGKKGE